MKTTRLCCVVLTLLSLSISAAPTSEFSPEEIAAAKKVVTKRREKLFQKGETNYRLRHTQQLLEGAFSTVDKAEKDTHLDYTRLKREIQSALEEIKRIDRLMAVAQAELPPQE